MKQDEVLVTTYSYEGDRLKWMSIDLATGNILSENSYTDLEVINSGQVYTNGDALICIPELNKFIYKNTLFDYEAENWIPQYLTKKCGNNFLAEINKTKLRYTGSTLTYLDKKLTGVSTLVHKNNIIISKERLTI